MDNTDNKIYWHIPGFCAFRLLNQLLMNMMKSYPEYFNEGYSRKGMYELVNYPAVNKAKNSIRNIKYDNDYISLEKRIEYTIKI